MDARQLLDADRAHVWHPYAPMPGGRDPFVVASAEGVRLRMAAPVGGHDELIDAMSSWWAAIHGYRHPVLDAAITRQLGSMSHVMFGGLTHEPAVRLVERLVELTPAPLEHVFLCDSGSVGVEVAIKMCLQFWRSQGASERKRLLTWKGGYHGDTFFAMSVCDPDGGMHSYWTDVLPAQVFADAPPAGVDAPLDETYAAHFAALARAHRDELAAIVVEPVVQGTGGMRFHNPAYLRFLRDLADELDVLLVFDEIATGFGRTGALFAADHAGVSPDVMCLGKALTGGYLSLAATLCTARVASGIGQGDLPVLAHGPTFMGNPLACAVALASIDLLRSADWAATVATIGDRLRAGLAPAAAIDHVRDVRVLGAIGVIELERPVDIARATDAAAREGVWLRPFSRLVYTMPPYVATSDDIDRIAAGMVAAAEMG